MAYSKETLALDIDILFPRYSAMYQKWPWKRDSNEVIPDFKEQLKDVCWTIYNKTHTDGGEQIMGREWDTDPFAAFANIGGRTGYTAKTSFQNVGHGRYEKVVNWKPVGAAAKSDHEINTSDTARGNVLKMDRWHPTMNDCWVLGGVHRRATFKLVSARVPGNIWNFQYNFPVVTARELLGLLRYGYTIQRRGSAEALLIPGNVKKEPETILDYWNYINNGSITMTNLIKELLDPNVKALNDQINARRKG